AARRAALMQRHPLAIHIDAGSAPGRNYPANPYPFRASSHFLYLVGAPLEGATLWLANGEATIYVPQLPDGDALWHGARLSMAALADVLGCAVRALDHLPDGGATPADPSLADALIAARLVHDAAALNGLRLAASATVDAHLAGMRSTRVGEREWCVRAAMDAAMRRHGMGWAYQPIVTVHGEVLHNHHHHHVMADGDLLLADVGAESHGGWAGDVTRTWPVNGRFSPTQAAIYEVVLAAQIAAIDAARPGVRYRDVHLTAARQLTVGLVDLGILRGDVDELVADDVHALFFPHGVGHVLGLDVHDMEDLGDRTGYPAGRTRSDRFGLGYLRLDRDLEPGMAVTIEPGFYQVPALLDDPARTAKAGDRLRRDVLAKFADVRGIRVEDDIVITAGAPEVLTAAAPKTIAAVEAEMRR
ncbi:MAG: Xaa-Pro aminopeptidase, partial [Bradymonadia bacterium]